MIFSKCKSDFYLFPKRPASVPQDETQHAWHGTQEPSVTGAPIGLQTFLFPCQPPPAPAHTACFRPLHVLLTGCCDLKCSPSLVPLERSYPFTGTALLCPIVPLRPQSSDLTSPLTSYTFSTCSSHSSPSDGEAETHPSVLHL